MWCQKIITFLLPTLALQGTPWREEWERRSRQEFIFTMKILFFTTAIVYLFHHFIIDAQLGLSTQNLWIVYRLGMASVCLTIFALYFVPFVQQSGLYWVLGYLGVVAICFLQAKSMLWYNGIHFLYVLLLNVIGVLVLRPTMLVAILFFGGLTILEYPSVVSANVDPIHFISLSTVCLALIIFIRSRVLTDIDHYITNQKYLQTEKKVIELDLELHDQIKSFLPKVVYQRIFMNVKKNQRSVVDAMDDVLHPRKLPIACIWSDIRGFTQHSKELDAYVLKSALPNIKSMTNLVEKCGGIPCLIGDLVFGYFDDTDLQTNVARSIVSGALLIEINRKFNKSTNEEHQIRRHILLSAGDAVVGNIGGEDASRNITALGSPVNILSRIDTLTKDHRVKEALKGHSLILTSYFNDCLKEIDKNWEIYPLSLDKLGIQLRDFPEEKTLYMLPVEGANHDLLGNLLDRYLPYN